MFLVRLASLTLALFLACGCNSLPLAGDGELASNSASTRNLPAGWRAESVPGATPGRRLVALRRDAIDAPAVLRLVAIPGSGCTGFAPFAARYFNGLKRAQVIVLHKPYSDLFGGPAPAECPPEFLQYDALANWRDDAIAALKQLDPGDAAALPTIVLGISEGAEIVPYLVPALGKLIGMVFVSATGLDPAVVGAMQAARLGQTKAWDRLREQAASVLPDSTLVEGRTLRYWRDMFAWKLTAPLATLRVPLLRVWGADDALVPQHAYAALGASPARPEKLCDWRMAAADHGLQGKFGDGIQALWPRLERWAEAGRLDCAGDVGQLH